MKKYLYLILVLLAANNISFAQLNNSITVTGGLVDYNKNSIGGNLTYSFTKNNSNYEIGVSHFIFEKEYNGVIGTFSSSNLNLGYLYTFLRDRSNTLNFHFGGGVLGGYEQIQKNEELILKSKSGPIAGIYAALAFDLYFSDGFALTLRGNQYYLFKSSTGNTNPYVGAGFKFNF